MRLYLDTTEWIYHFEGSGQFGPAATALVERMYRGRHTAISSLFVLSEILVVPQRNADEFSIARLLRRTQRSKRTQTPDTPECFLP